MSSYFYQETRRKLPQAHALVDMFGGSVGIVHRKEGGYAIRVMIPREFRDTVALPDTLDGTPLVLAPLLSRSGNFDIPELLV